MTDVRVAVITGVHGQDGWYLARRLLGLGYRVVGTTHRADAAGALAIEDTTIEVVAMDLSSTESVRDVIRTYRPSELYNFAARASSAQLFDDPLATTDINGVAVVRMLEAIRHHSPETRLCQASSSEIFNAATTSPQDEATPPAPRNAYAAAKTFADHAIAAYRAAHNVFACSAILFPHESPRRPRHFLVRKVTHAAAAVRAKQLASITLGDLSAVRDWGYSPDVVEAMRRMLQQSEPRDYILATGVPHTVQDVCEVAFGHVGLRWQDHVVVDPALVRGPEAVPRIGNPARARAELEWVPTLGFSEMIGYMVDSERP